MLYEHTPTAGIFSADVCVRYASVALGKSFTSESSRAGGATSVKSSLKTVPSTVLPVRIAQSDSTRKGRALQVKRRFTFCWRAINHGIVAVDQMGVSGVSVSKLLEYLKSNADIAPM